MLALARKKSNQGGKVCRGIVCTTLSPMQQRSFSNQEALMLEGNMKPESNVLEATR